MNECDTYRELLPRMLAQACRYLENPSEQKRISKEFAEVALAYAQKAEERNPMLAERLCQSGVEILERGGVMHRNHVI